MLGGGKPNPYLDKKNLEKRNVLPEQREDLLNFLRALNVGLRIEETSVTAELSRDRCIEYNLQVAAFARSQLASGERSKLKLVLYTPVRKVSSIYCYY